MNVLYDDRRELISITIILKTYFLSNEIEKKKK